MNRRTHRGGTGDPYGPAVTTRESGAVAPAGPWAQWWRRLLTALRSDRGAGTLEYQGILVVGALLVVGVLSAVVVFPDEARSAVCRISSALEGGGGDCASTTADDGPPTDEMLRPGVCMLSATSTTGGGGVSLGFVELGADWGVQVTQYSDGTVHATATNGASAGAKAEAGGDVGAAEASVSAYAGVTYQHGDTWIVPAAEWPEFQRNAEEYFGQTGWRWLGAGSWWGAREPRAPDVTHHEGGAEAALAGGASVGAEMPGGGKGGDAKGGGAADDEQLGYELAGISAEAAGAVKVKHERNGTDGTVTWTYTLEGSASAEGKVVAVEAGAQIGRTGSFAVKRDSSGELVEVTFETVARGGAHVGAGVEVVLDGLEPSGKHDAEKDSVTYSGGVGNAQDDVVVTTTTLEIDDDNRDLVEDWLAERGGGLLAPIPVSPLVPSAPSDDPLMQALYEKGKTSRNVYDSSETTAGGGVSVSAGVGAGVEVERGDGSQTVREAEFLGSPRQDGTRPFLPNTMCK